MAGLVVLRRRGVCTGTIGPLQRCARSLRTRAALHDGACRTQPAAASMHPSRPPAAAASAQMPPCRSIASASSGGGEDDVSRAQQFVIERGATAEVAERVIAELQSGWGVRPGGMLEKVHLLAGRWEVGEDNGLASLVKAVELEMAEQSGKQRVRFFVQQPNSDRRFYCDALEGMTLKEVVEHGDDEGASTLAEYLECACSGVMACSTCHVYVDEKWFSRLPAATEEEEDMLDLAYERRDNSRLGCQIVLSPEIDGLEVVLPKGANNVFDHIPFG